MGRLTCRCVMLFGVLKAIGGSRPFCDALTNVLSIDAIELVMWWHVGESSMAVFAMWALFLVDGVYLFGLWIDAMKKNVIK